MARPAVTEQTVLLQRLSAVFRDMGYEGASLTQLAAAAQLKKASLYHRFPGGKEQMANEVLANADKWLRENVLDVLRGDLPPERRVRRAMRAFDEYYNGGMAPCLTNMLSAANANDGPFGEPIRKLLESLIEGLEVVARDSGHNEKQARIRAERSVVRLQGSLVVSRALGNKAAFKDFLRTLPAQLLARKVAEAAE